MRTAHAPVACPDIRATPTGPHTGPGSRLRRRPGTWRSRALRTRSSGLAAPGLGNSGARGLRDSGPPGVRTSGPPGAPCLGAPGLGGARTPAAVSDLRNLPGKVACAARPGPQGGPAVSDLAALAASAGSSAEAISRAPSLRPPGRTWNADTYQDGCGDGGRRVLPPRPATQHHSPPGGPPGGGRNGPDRHGAAGTSCPSWTGKRRARAPRPHSFSYRARGAHSSGRCQARRSPGPRLVARTGTVPAGAGAQTVRVFSRRFFHASRSAWAMKNTPPPVA